MNRLPHARKNSSERVWKRGLTSDLPPVAGQRGDLPSLYHFMFRAGRKVKKSL
jgi:hypothetical protein